MPLRLPADPGGRAIRRAFRAALILPLTLLAAMNIPFMQAGALLASFACLSLTLFADFGGELKRRFIAYLATTAAGVPLIIAGTLAGQSLIASIVTAFVVAMAVGLVAVLRGVVAAAQTVLLLALILSLTTGDPETLLPSVCAWVFGGLVAGVAAVTLWPLRTSMPIRRGVAAVIDGIADACEARWITHDADALHQARAASTDALAALHKSYDGNLLRPSGVTASDRAVADLVDEVGRLRYIQRWEDVSSERDAHLQRIMAQECDHVVYALRACAERLRGSGGPLSSKKLFDSRAKNLDEMSQWLEDHRETQVTTRLREQLDDAFPLRITTLVATRITDLTIMMDPRPSDELATVPGEGQVLSLKPASRRQRLRSQLSWESPWFRNATRTAVALAISVAVAKSVTLEHPFWIVLGTLSALRFDALGTGRQAWQAFLGTSAGVAFSAVVLSLVGTNETVWWILLPLSVFVAAYTPGTTSFAVGQAAFTFVVIALFSILSPVGTRLAEVRWFDVVLGLLISLLVSVLMWPRGVIETLHKRLRDAMTDASDFYIATTDWLADGAIDERLLRGFGQRSWQSLDIAREAVDLAIAQRPPKAIAVQRWTAMANTVRHVDFAARLAPQARRTVIQRGEDRTVPMPLVGPLLYCSNDVRERLNAAAESWIDEPDPPTFDVTLPHFTTAESVTVLRESIDTYLQQPSDYTGSGPDPRPAIITWLADWTALFDRSAQVLGRQTPTTQTPH